MEKLVFDSGIKEYQINGKGVLRFNPGDPNVYARFMDSIEKIQEVEKEMVAKNDSINRDSAIAGVEVLAIMRETDQKMKAILNEIFGHENDFDKILEGVNLMGVASNGERVITNLIAALQPVMEAGAKTCAGTQVNEAKLNREQRRALNR